MCDKSIRDDDIVRRAQLWATGSTIHEVNGLIGTYRGCIHWLDNPDISLEDKELIEEDRQTAYRRLSDFMKHGNYRLACEDNPYRERKAC